MNDEWMVYWMMLNYIDGYYIVVWHTRTNLRTIPSSSYICNVAVYHLHIPSHKLSLISESATSQTCNASSNIAMRFAINEFYSNTASSRGKSTLNHSER